MTSCLVLAPAEVIKQNAQMIRDEVVGSQARVSTSLQAFRQLGGPGAAGRLFSGYTALVARNLPFTALQFPLFEHIRSRLWASRTRGNQSRRRGILETGVVGAVSAGSAGAFAAFITTPGDVVKTKMMLTAGDKQSNPRNRVKRGFRSVCKGIYAERGVKGLFRGGLFRSGWTALGSSLYLGTYDTAKLWLRRRKPSSDVAIQLE